MSLYNKFNGLYQRIKKESSIFAGISFGVFLFFLFFQPVPFDKFDFNNKLLFVAGIAAIVFVMMILIRFVFTGLVQRISEFSNETVFQSYISGFLIFILTTVAIVFYVRYVGSVTLTFFIIFKIVLICLCPPLILRFDLVLYELRYQNKTLIKEIKKLHAQLEEIEEHNQHRTITLYSESSSEKLKFMVSEVVLIKSADNYVEIVYKTDQSYKKKLMRNSLKNIEHQIAHDNSFIRCHRTCIVNLIHVEDLIRKYNNYWLNIKDYEEQVPVSRQYLNHIRETINLQKG